ncbi:MAG: hypothetical protein M3R49_05665 [Chloroflexota bacterium]|nr:hypothetical protein [Chloroflexota bacterium]MDQ2941236.1 hypothetical protein [Chloroflexota bacterium]
MQAGSSLRPGGRAIALIVVWLVAVVIVAATSQVRAGDARPSGTARVAAAQPVSPHEAKADSDESPAVTLAIVAVLAAGGLTVATQRRGLAPVRVRRLMPVAQRAVVRRS